MVVVVVPGTSGTGHTSFFLASRQKVPVLL